MIGSRIAGPARRTASWYAIVAATLKATSLESTSW